jgi:hypothetical protein
MEVIEEEPEVEEEDKSMDPSEERRRILEREAEKLRYKIAYLHVIFDLKKNSKRARTAVAIVEDKLLTEQEMYNRYRKLYI